MPSGDQADNGPTKARRTEESPTQGDSDSSLPRNRLRAIETVAENSVSSASEASGPPGPASGAVADLNEFKRTLVELGLLSSAELKAFEVDASLGVLGLARSLVRAGRLTPYQSAAIYQKKSRGLLIGDYQILEKLGQGGMGVVFKARHRQSGRLGALKILPPSFARDRTAVMRFKREIEAAGRLKHPNLVAAFDAAEDRGVHFLVMDYVAGSDLDHIIRARGPMSVVEAVQSTSRYDELVRRARKIVDAKDAPSSYLNTFGALLYRAGKYESAVNFLNRSIRNSKNDGSALDYVFLALATHRLRRGDAQNALKRARELALRASPPWHERIEVKALLAEAQAELKLTPAR